MNLLSRERGLKQVPDAGSQHGAKRTAVSLILAEQEPEHMPSFT